MTAKLKQNTIFNNIHQDYQTDLKSLDSLILSRLESPVPLIKQVSSHLIQAGGKRLRPILTFIAAKMLGYNKGERHIHMGACIEFIHTATLLHDDVVDNSTKRRGLESANDVWGNKTSILVGDFLFSKAFELMVPEDPRIIKILSNAASVIASGEVLQLSKEKDLTTTTEDYFSIIKSKTAALFSAACAVGGLISNAQEEEIKVLSDFGDNLGILFQITDDLLDFGIETSIPGKNIGDDIKDGRITLPIIYLMQQNPESKNLIQSCFDPNVNFEKALKEIQNSLIEHKIPEKIMDLTKHITTTCKDLLSMLPEGNEKEYLRGIIDYVNNRTEY